jgi:hypothetical protein
MVQFENPWVGRETGNLRVGCCTTWGNAEAKENILQYNGLGRSTPIADQLEVE